MSDLVVRSCVSRVCVVVVYVDGYSTAESLTSGPTAAEVNVNDASTGSVNLSGTATQGQTLTVSRDLQGAVQESRSLDF